MRITILAIFLGMTGFQLFLKYLTYSHRNKPLPENVRDIYDPEEYKRSQNYRMAVLRHSIVTSLVSTAVTLVILLTNFHAGLFEFILLRTYNLYLTDLFIYLLPFLIAKIIDIPFDLYNTFGIEARFGFNKSSVGTFILDQIKSTGISLVVMSSVLILFVWLYGWLGNAMFPIFFVIMLLIALFIMFISPILIRIFNKLTPLEEGSLKVKITEMAMKTGYKLKGIYRVDASRRSTKLNAFAIGFGKSKTIGLFDTLIEKMEEDEIVSVLLHEIGHAEKKHMIKRFPLIILSFSMLIVIAYMAVTMPGWSQAFGFAYSNIAFAFYIIFILASPLMMLFMFPANALSRKHEYEADKYATDRLPAEIMESALKKLIKENLGDLNPHPFVVALEYRHPPAHQRLAAIERNKTCKS